MTGCELSIGIFADCLHRGGGFSPNPITDIPSGAYDATPAANGKKISGALVSPGYRG
jgi:hypothetical protein